MAHINKLGVILTMRFKNTFLYDDQVRSLLKEFSISQGPLFHYTNEQSIKNILSTNEIQLTRADHFLDNREINYGVNLLKGELAKAIKDNYKDIFEKVINSISSRLKSCYIFCFTQSSDSDRHKSIHGDNIIRFEENFPVELANTSRHSIPYEDGYKLYYSIDLYEYIEGFVIYDYQKQKALARQICLSFNKLNDNNAHIIDQFLYVDLLIQYIIICKEQCYDWEKEYRIGLIPTKNWNSQFENISENKKPFIKLFVPTSIKEYNNNA